MKPFSWSKPVEPSGADASSPGDASPQGEAPRQDRGHSIALLGLPASGKTSFLYALKNPGDHHATGQRPWIIGLKTKDFDRVTGREGSPQPATEQGKFEPVKLCEMRRVVFGKRDWGRSWGTTRHLVIPEIAGEMVQRFALNDFADTDNSLKRVKVRLDDYLDRCDEVVFLAALDGTGGTGKTSPSPAIVEREVVRAAQSLRNILEGMKSRREPNERIFVTFLLTKRDRMRDVPALDHVAVPAHESAVGRALRGRPWLAAALVRDGNDGTVEFRLNEVASLRESRSDVDLQEALACDFLRCHAPKAAQNLAELAAQPGFSVRILMSAPYGRSFMGTAGQAVFPRLVDMDSAMVFEALEDLVERRFRWHARITIARRAWIAAAVLAGVALLGPALSWWNDGRIDAAIAAQRWKDAESDAQAARWIPWTHVRRLATANRVDEARRLQRIAEGMASANQGTLDGRLRERMVWLDPAQATFAAESSATIAERLMDWLCGAKDGPDSLVLDGSSVRKFRERVEDLSADRADADPAFWGNVSRRCADISEAVSGNRVTFVTQSPVAGSGSGSPKEEFIASVDRARRTADAWKAWHTDRTRAGGIDAAAALGDASLIAKIDRAAMEAGGEDVASFGEALAGLGAVGGDDVRGQARRVRRAVRFMSGWMADLPRATAAACTSGSSTDRPIRALRAQLLQVLETAPWLVRDGKSQLLAALEALEGREAALAILRTDGLEGDDLEFTANERDSVVTAFGAEDGAAAEVSLAIAGSAEPVALDFEPAFVAMRAAGCARVGDLLARIPAERADKRVRLVDVARAIDAACPAGRGADALLALLEGADAAPDCDRVVELIPPVIKDAVSDPDQRVFKAIGRLADFDRGLTCIERCIRELGGRQFGLDGRGKERAVQSMLNGVRYLHAVGADEATAIAQAVGAVGVDWSGILRQRMSDQVAEGIGDPDGAALLDRVAEVRWLGMQPGVGWNPLRDAVAEEALTRGLRANPGSAQELLQAVANGAGQDIEALWSAIDKHRTLISKYAMRPLRGENGRIRAYIAEAELTSGESVALADGLPADCADVVRALSDRWRNQKNAISGVSKACAWALLTEAGLRLPTKAELASVRGAMGVPAAADDPARKAVREKIAGNIHKDVALTKEHLESCGDVWPKVAGRSEAPCGPFVGLLYGVREWASDDEFPFGESTASPFPILNQADDGVGAEGDAGIRAAIDALPPQFTEAMSP